MKQLKVLIIILIFVFVSSCTKVYHSAEELKKDFIKVYCKSEYILTGPDYSIAVGDQDATDNLSIIGKYGDGYLLNDHIVHTMIEPYTVVTYEEVELYIHRETTYYYFVNKEIYKGLDYIYSLGFLSKDDLIDLQSKILKSGNRNYINLVDYFEW